MTRIEQLGEISVAGQCRAHHVFVSDVDHDLTTFSIWPSQSSFKSATPARHVTLRDPDGKIAHLAANHNRVHNGIDVPDELPPELQETPEESGL